MAGRIASATQETAVRTNTPASDTQPSPAPATRAACDFRDAASMARLRRKLFCFALRELRSADLAEDVTQEAMIALFMAPERYRGDARFDVYAIGVLRHKIADHFRASRRETPVAPETLDALREDAGDARRRRLRLGGAAAGPGDGRRRGARTGALLANAARVPRDDAGSASRGLRAARRAGSGAWPRCARTSAPRPPTFRSWRIARGRTCRRIGPQASANWRCPDAAPLRARVVPRGEAGRAARGAIADAEAGRAHRGERLDISRQWDRPSVHVASNDTSGTASASSFPINCSIAPQPGQPVQGDRP